MFGCFAPSVIHDRGTLLPFSDTLLTEFSEVESLRPTSRNAEVVHPNGLIRLVGNVCPPPLNARAIPCGWKRAMMAPMIPTASTLSDVPEHRREDDHDNRRPHSIDRQVI